MGGSSGGSSGEVSYPEYMQTIHSTWLTAVAADLITAQTGDSPYTAAVAYDPDCVLAATNYIISLFYDEVIAMAPATDWSTYYDAAAAKYTAATITAITDYTFDTITGYTFSPTLGTYVFPNLSDAVDDYSLNKNIDGFIFDTNILSDSALAALVAAYQADLEARRDASYKPSYKVGMLNVNSVMNSAFVLGDTLTTAEVAREVAKFSADLYFQNEQKKIEYQQIQAQEHTGHNSNVISYEGLKVEDNKSQEGNFITYEGIKAQDNNAYNNSMISYEQVKAGENTGHNSNTVQLEGAKAGENTAHNANIIKRDAVIVTHDTANRIFNAGVAESIMARDIAHLSLYQSLGQLTTEANRIKIVSKTEQNERDIRFDVKDATWDMEMYTYGGNVLASISGAASSVIDEVSTAQSVLGGALSGAALGSQISPGMGTMIGAALGGLGGLLMG